VHLENGLSSELGRKVSVLNAAVPGFVSTQERIMLDLMVLPRKPDLVVFLHGLNDISIPMGYGVRPGDPFTQAVTYRASSSLAFDVLRRAARVSFIASSLTNWLMTPPPEGYYPELATNLALRSGYIESTTATFETNLSSMMATCRHAGVPCVSILQPGLPITQHRIGAEIEDPSRQPWMRTLGRIVVDGYRALWEHRRQLAQEGRFFDASGAFDEPGQVERFLDLAHFDDGGQKALADYVQPFVLAKLRDLPHGRLPR
jgi:lysophospholipase L1-like esterase